MALGYFYLSQKEASATGAKNRSDKIEHNSVWKQNFDFIAEKRRKMYLFLYLLQWREEKPPLPPINRRWNNKSLHQNQVIAVATWKRANLASNDETCRNSMNSKSAPCVWMKRVRDPKPHQPASCIFQIISAHSIQDWRMLRNKTG